MKLRTALQLGRVSNLPTVWTNTLAGAVLAGAGGFGAEFALMLLAFSLFYTGGMFLNDAFDAGFDAVQRPERPIPSGEIGARAVFAWGLGLMAGSIALLALFGIAPALAGVTLATAIIFYDWHHKKNLFGPVVMGLCRVLIYVGAGLCITLALPAGLWIGAALMLCYLIGLTYIAKQENLGRVENLWPLVFLAAPVAYGAWLAMALPAAGLFWLLFTGWMLVALWFLRRRRKGDIPRAVVSLIAGISLLDALLIAGAGSLTLAGFALAGFGVTLFFQRYISGT
ncbi:MAG: UbiA family prenyltransferase [Proteobacteria bacterium]|nr:UbiA family prenyltransferase [Pseudomonadota bacterium]